MLKIYGGKLSSPVNKVCMTANYIGIKYEFIQTSPRAGDTKKAEFLKINPVGKIPAIDDDGFYVFESGAICRYLAQKHNSALYPADLKKRAVVDEWSDFAVMHIATSVSKILYNTVFYKFTGDSIDERSMAEGHKFLGRFLPLADAQLGKDNFFAGDKISLADISLLTALDPAEVCSFNLSPYKNIVKWRNSLKKEDFYQKCYKEYGEELKQTAK